MTQAKPIKVCVYVLAAFGADGRVIPRALVWEDGRKYAIEKVLECKPAAAMRAGGQGERFTIRVNGRESYLYFKRNTQPSGNHLGRWFVERRAV